MENKIYTSYFGNWRKFPKDSTSFSLARVLKWESDMEKLVCFAPTNDLFSAYKAELITEEEFKENYLKQLEDIPQEELDSVIEKIKEVPNDSVLLCYEKKGEFCHRHILKDFLNERYDLQIKEL